MPEEVRQALEGWKSTQTLRAREPREHAGRPEVTITGDGSVGGTHLAWAAGFEPPGAITRIQIDLDADKPNQLASGKVFYTRHEDDELIAAGAMDVWVRFGA